MTFPEIKRAKIYELDEGCINEHNDDGRYSCGCCLENERLTRAAWARKLAEFLHTNHPELADHPKKIQEYCQLLLQRQAIVEVELLRVAKQDKWGCLRDDWCSNVR